MKREEFTLLAWIWVPGMAAGLVTPQQARSQRRQVLTLPLWLLPAKRFILCRARRKASEGDFHFQACVAGDFRTFGSVFQIELFFSEERSQGSAEQ